MQYEYLFSIVRKINQNSVRYFFLHVPILSVDHHVVNQSTEFSKLFFFYNEALTFNTLCKMGFEQTTF